MADFTDIKAEIDANIIPHNNAQLITGEKLNTTLQDMVDVVNEDKADASALATETAARIAADDTKVDKVSGKGLSTNDYTNAEKSKVTNAPANTTAELATKVDKIAGKGLSANDYTDAEKAKVANVPADTETALAGKVDKVSGKGLSANDYTDAEKAKLGALPTAAALSSSLDGKVDKVAGKGLSSEDYTAAEKGKVANMPADTNAELADIVAESTDRKALELLCGQPPILFGAGTPQEAIVPDNWKQFDPETGEGYNWNGNPSAIGQQYINTSVVSGGRYVAGRTSYDKASANYYVLKWYNS